MYKQSLLLFILLVPAWLCSEFTLVTSHSEPLVCSLVQANSPLHDEEKVFVNAFSEAYRAIPLEVLGVKSVQSFLTEAFNEERADLAKAEETIYFFSARVRDQVAALISFSPTEIPHEVYIRALAVDPSYKNQGIGKALVSLCTMQLPDTVKLTLATRRVNTGACEFYKKLGFTEMNTVPHNYNPERYIGLEYNTAR
jgi:ribosomal protein S18 acetylase RimI-like enzyme